MMRRLMLCAALLIHRQIPAQPVAPPEQVAPTLTEDAHTTEALLLRMESIDSRTDSIQDLKADFEQQKFTSLLKKPLVSTGTIRMKGSTVRWDTVKPRESSMEMKPGRIRVFDPQEKVVEVYEAQGDLRELTVSPLPRLKTLTSRFKISPLDPKTLQVEQEHIPNSQEERYLCFELTPSTEDLKKYVTSVRVVIDTTIPSLLKMEITDADGDRSLLSLSNIAINSKLTDEEIQLSLPEGTRVSHPGKPAPKNDPSRKSDGAERGGT